MPYTVLIIYILKTQNKHKLYQTNKNLKPKIMTKHTHRAKSCHNFLLPALDAATLALGWYSVYYLTFSPRKQRAGKYSLQSGPDYCGWSNFSSPLIPISLCSSIAYGSTEKYNLLEFCRILQVIIPVQLHIVQHLPSQAEHQLHFQSILSNQWWVGTVRAKEWFKHHGTIKALKQRWLISFNWHHSPMIYQYRWTNHK